MASSGSLSKFSAYDGTHKHWIDWTATQSISGNYSDVTMNFKSEFSSSFGVYSTWTGDNKIRFNGTNYDGGKFTGSSGPHTQFSITKRVYHNSDGTGSFTLGGVHRNSKSPPADYKYWSDVTQTLDKIPRASTLSSFSMGANLKVGTANSINLGLSRASTSFKHHIYLKHGTTTIASWTNQDVPSSLAVTATQVNTLLARIPTATTAGMTLQVQTVSGTNGSNVGGVLSRTATATVDSTVRPTATTPSVSIYGSGHDKTIGKYVQNKSRITASFTSAAVGGASVVSHYMTVQRLSDGANSQTISGTSGTTGSPVTLSGTYRISTYVKDGRGRTAVTRSKDITVHAYAAPKISSFSIVRQSTATKLSISRSGTWSHLGGDNTLTIKVQYKLSTASSWTTTDTTTSTTGSFSGSFTKTGFDVLKSYDFLLTVTDQFGTKSTSVTNVSTQSVVLDIHKDEGIGIGKVHEHGALDVQGDTYFNGVKVDLSTAKHIKESGSNSHGTYIKFDDGNMICYHKEIRTVNANEVVAYTWYYPATFKSGIRPTVSLTAGTSSGAVVNAAKLTSGVAGGGDSIGPTDTSCAAAIHNLDTTRSRDVQFHLTAIGRWK